MSKKNDSSCLGKYIAMGLVVGTAVGTCAAVMMTAKKKKPEGFRERALEAFGTVGTIMHNISNMAR